MKYKIHTAPIWDAFKEKCACPLCRIENDISNKLVDQFLNEACMEPSYRMELNKFGLCASHANEMLDGGKLAFALQLATRCEEIKKGLSVCNKKNCKKEAARMLASQNSCVICKKTGENISTYYETIARMYAYEEEFRALIKEQEGFCVRHYAMLVDMAGFAKDRCEEYLAELYRIQNNLLGTLRQNLNLFAEIFDYRKGGAPTEDIKQTPKKGIALLTER